MQDSTKQVIEALKPLADKIGEGAAHLYQVYIQQTIYEGIGFFIVTGLALLMSTVLLIVAIRAGKGSEWKYGEPQNSKAAVEIASYSVGGAVGLIAILIIMLASVDNFTKIVNPEYHAINKLVEQVTPDKQ